MTSEPTEALLSLRDIYAGYQGAPVLHGIELPEDADDPDDDEEKLADIYIGLSALESYQHLNEVVTKLGVFLGRANNPAIYALPICYQCNEVCINSFL